MTLIDKETHLKEVRLLLKKGEQQKAFERLIEIADPADDCTLQHTYTKLFEKIDSGLSGLADIRIAILPSSTVYPLTHVLRFWLAKQGFRATFFEADYGTLQQTVLSPQSDFYQFSPDVTFIFTNYRDVQLLSSAAESASSIQEKVTNACEAYAALWKQIRAHSQTFIIQNNVDAPYERVYGNYEGASVGSLTNIFRRFNAELPRYLIPGSTILDIDFLASVFGRRQWHNKKFWYHSKHAFALDATGLVAAAVAGIIGALKGTAKKCLVLDLDNTLWGGVVAEVGIEGIALGAGPEGEAFVDFQKYLLKLKQRGVLLAVCSKNSEENAREPFLKHPDMQIRLDDIIVFKANWDDKVTNIRAIAQELNLGLDAFVFIDDNPAERLLVRSMLPEVTVPDLPSDPSEYVDALSSRAYFEMVSFSSEDQKRSEYYKGNIQRGEFKQQFVNLTEYLKSLAMTMEVAEINDFNLPRAAQLINRSNQFHLTTTRYSETEIMNMQQSKHRLCRCFTLQDCFGDNGLISVVILEKTDKDTLLIDTWVMSCRVLARGVEEFIMRDIVKLAKKLHCSFIRGRYLPTKKNALVKELYGRLFFEKIQEDQGAATWELPLNKEHPAYKSYIEQKDGKG